MEPDDLKLPERYLQLTVDKRLTPEQLDQLEGLFQDAEEKLTPAQHRYFTALYMKALGQIAHDLEVARSKQKPFWRRSTFYEALLFEWILPLQLLSTLILTYHWVPVPALPLTACFLGAVLVTNIWLEERWGGSNV